MAPHDVEVQASHLSITLKDRNGLFQRFAKASGIGKSKEDPNTRRILDDVSLNIKGPSLTAIIGPSGSGKTTLLNTLSSRLGGNLGQREGSISIFHQGMPIVGASNVAEHVAYVQQEDVLFPNLTVRETLKYAAALGSESCTSEAVEGIIKALRLGSCANTRIGDKAHKGCSGGEIRRTSIGVQILRGQQILILDEPTTGLDPKAALEVIQVLKDLVDHQDKTVLITLHQPRSEIWPMVGQLIVMSQGALLYAGQAQASLQHFADAGYSLPKLENPFDFVSDLIAVDTRNERDEKASQNRVDDLRRVWANKSSKCGMRIKQIHGSSLEFARSVLSENNVRQERPARFIHRLKVHSQRTLLLTLRDRLGIIASLLEALCMGLACGLIFYQLGTDLTGIRSRQGALYCTSSMQSYLVLLYEIYRLTVDMPTFDRERADGMVTPCIFYFSRRLTRFFVEDIPVPLFFSLAFYFMAGLRPGVSEFCSYFLVQFLLHLISVNFAICCVVPTRELMIAGLLANFSYAVECFCAGLFINNKSFGPWVGWIRWITQLHYGFGAMCSIEFTGRLFDCPWSGGAADARCQQFTGDFIMASLGLAQRWFAVPIGALCGFTAVYAVVAIGALHWIPGSSVKTPGVKERGGLEGETRHMQRNGSPIHLALDELQVHIMANTVPRHSKVGSVIGPISADFTPGTLNAILGPSGSGKSTILNAISGRLRQSMASKSRQNGCVRFTGIVLSAKEVSSVGSFVPQNDFGLLDHLTVRETLQYAARLRLPATLSKQEKSRRVETVLLELGLKHCADTVVGSTHVRGISGGEKRRLSIAVQMLANPSVLLLDEPTSGLDAFIASTIIEVLQRLASEGRTIVMVLHQPRWTYMQACAKLLMLSCNGQQAFCGPGEDLVQELGTTCVDASLAAANPADMALDRLADGHLVASAIELEEKEYGSSAASQTSSNKSESGATSDTPTLHVDSGRRLSFFHVLPILIRRSMTNLRRAPILLFGRVAQIAGTGVIVVLFFTPLGYDYASTQTRIGVIGQASALFFVGMVNALALYPAELDLFVHEFRDGVYDAEAFFTSYTLIELPIEIVGSLILSLLMVFATRLSDRVDVYLLIAYTSFAIVNCGESLGMMVLSFVRHTGLAVSIMSVFLSLCTALNGAFSLDMLVWIQGLNNLSPAKWQVQASASMSLRGVQFTCADAERLHDGSCPIQSGEQLLRLYNLDVSTTKAACILAGVTVGYRVLAYVALKHLQDMVREGVLEPKT